MTLADHIRAAKRVFIIGNGGSAANASHIVNDLLSVDVPAFDINQPFFSATANDFGYEDTFSRWLKVVGEPGDLLIALSGSGRSPNIVKAIETATSIGMQSHLITDFLRTMDMQASEERQLHLGHEIMKALRDHR